MARRSKKVDTSYEIEPHHPTTVQEIREHPTLTPPALQEIRSRMSNQRASTSQTIAELETWRSEIDATIAFLRGDEIKR